MRRDARVDGNHLDICSELKLFGASVQSTAMIGRGFPDAVVGFRGTNYLIEFKRSKGKLNEIQEEFHSKWNGKIVILRSIEEAREWVTGLRQ